MARWLALFLLFVSTAPGAAQSVVIPPEQPRCWLGAMSYSPGATIRAGTTVMVCTSDFAWVPTEQEAAGCVHSGNFYGIGAIQNASSQQQILSECRPDGTWGRVVP